MTHASDSSYMALLAACGHMHNNIRKTIRWLDTSTNHLCIYTLILLNLLVVVSNQTIMYIYNNIGTYHKFRQTSKSVDSLPLTAERMLWCSVCCMYIIVCMGALPKVEIFHGIIRILNYQLWSLPSQPVGLIELLRINFFCIIYKYKNTRLIGHSMLLVIVQIFPMHWLPLLYYC